MAEGRRMSKLEQVILASLEAGPQRERLLELARNDPLLRALPDEFYRDGELLTAAVTLVANSTPEQRSDPAFERMLSDVLTDPNKVRGLIRFANLPADTKIAFSSGLYLGTDITDGKERERGAVVIKVMSIGPTSGSRHARIALWKTRGRAAASTAELEASEDAVRLITKDAGNEIRYVDTDVMPGKTYNYYTVMDYTNTYGRRYELTFKTDSHAVLKKETRIKYADRRIAEHEKMEELKRKTAPPPAPIDPVALAEKMVDDILNQGTVLARVSDVIDAKLGELLLTDTDKKRIRAEVKRSVMNVLDKGRG